MNKKLLMQVGIGAGVLVLVYLVYKKFMAKPAETKSTEAEATTDETSEAPVTSSATTETPRTKKKITNVTIPAQDLVSSPPPRRKQGITSAEIEKIKAERKRLKELGVKGDAMSSGLREFAEKNGIDYNAFQKFRERNQKTALANQFAGFMDVDSRDVQGQMM